MIAVGLPPSAANKWMEALPHPIRALSGVYEGLSEQMNNYPAFMVIQGVCSCGLFSRGSYEATLKKYKRKGWSQSKIERGILDRENRIQIGLSLELWNWLADAADDAGSAYVFIHWDSDRLAYEQKLSLSVEEVRDYKVSIKAEQLIHIKNNTHGTKSAPLN